MSLDDDEAPDPRHRRSSSTLLVVALVVGGLLVVVVGGGAAAYLKRARAAPTPPPLSLGGPTGSILWVEGSDPKAVPGLDSGGCYYLGTRLLIWADDVTSSGGGGSSGGPGGVRGDGRFLARDGRDVLYKFHITGEKTGAVVIDGVGYDLANGNLFLVKVGGGRSVVKQLDKDLSGVDMEHPKFREIGRADPAILAFFESPK